MDERGKTNFTGVAIGFLLAAAIGLGVAVYFLAVKEDEGGKKSGSPTTTVEETTTVTEGENGGEGSDKEGEGNSQSTTTTVEGTFYAKAIVKIQKQAKIVASRYVERNFGISIDPEGFTASCGQGSAALFNCKVSGNGGQCAGKVSINSNSIPSLEGKFGGHGGGGQSSSGSGHGMGSGSGGVSSGSRPSGGSGSMGGGTSRGGGGGRPGGPGRAGGTQIGCGE